jgi:hypothetical protein
LQAFINPTANSGKRERVDCFKVEMDNGGRLKTKLYDKRDDFFNSQVPLHQ